MAGSSYIPPTVQRAQRRSEVVDALLGRTMQPMAISDPLVGLAQLATTAFLANRSKKAGEELETAQAQAARDRATALTNAFGGGVPGVGGDPVTDAMVAQQAGGQGSPPSPAGGDPVVGALAGKPRPLFPGEQDGGSGADPVTDALVARPAGGLSMPSNQGTDPVVAALLADPSTADMGEQLALQAAKTRMEQAGKPPTTRTIKRGTQEVFQEYDPATRSWTEVGVGEPEWKDPGYLAAKREIAAAGRPVTNVSVKGEVKGAEAAWKNTADSWTAQLASVQGADRRAVLFDRFEDTLSGFKTGATADWRLKANQLAKDLGLQVANVGEGELLQSISRQLELAATPKGQGVITENERALIRETMPALNTSVEGNLQIIEMLRRLDAYDRQVLEIYTGSARANGGAPNPVEVAVGVAQLGPPLPPEQEAQLRAAAGSAQDAGKGKGGSPAPADDPFGYQDMSLEELEAERRRLGGGG